MVSNRNVAASRAIPVTARGIKMFSLPTLQELAESARQSFRAYLKGSDAWIWPNNIYASAKVIAGKTFEVFGFAAYIQKQMFAHTAPDLESLMLHGEEFGIPLKPAAPATGTVTFTGDVAFEVLTGAVLERTDGVQFIVSAGGVTAVPGTLDLPVIAATDGVNTNTEAGTPLQIISGVEVETVTAAVGSGGTTLGVDVEGIEEYRERILFRKRNPPHGGSAADYVIWAGQVSGVTRVYVERLWAGQGTVRIFPLMDDAYSDGIPSIADVERVSDHLSTLQPAGAQVAVAAPTPVVVNIEINSLLPNTTAVQEAVLAELRDMFKRQSRVAGIDQAHSGLPFLAYATSFSRSWIWQAVANATGEQSHVIVTPAADVTLAAGQMATLGSVTFT